MSFRICSLATRVCYLKRFIPSSSLSVSCNEASLRFYCDKPTYIPPGLLKQAELKREDFMNLNPGPPNTLDDIPIPFKPIEEAKKEFMPTINAYFYGSLLVLLVTAYYAIVIEGIIPYEEFGPVSSYRNRKKLKKQAIENGSLKPPPNSSDAKVAVAAAAGVVASATSEDSQTQAQEKSDEVNKGEVDEAEKPLDQESTASTTQSSAAVVNPNKIPAQITYLLIGSGTASYYASLAIRARDADAKVLIVGDEMHLPYNRPPLSKELWWFGDDKVSETLEYKGYRGKKKDVYFESPGFYVAPGEIDSAEHGGVALVTGHRVVKLDIGAHTAYLDDGQQIKYQKCLIATGGHPKSLSVIEKAAEEVKQKVTLFRTLDDFRKLEEIASNSQSITIVGGSFLGSELANSINKRFADRGLIVNQIFREKGNVAEVLPDFLSEYATNELKKIGVHVMPEQEIKDIILDDSGKLQMHLATGEVVNTDHIIVAVGIDARTELAKSSGLEIDSVNGGYIVDAELRARSDVWVAGDASSFYDVKLGRRRVEHWEHAQITGRLAGENMTGANKPYWHQSSYYSTVAPNVHFEGVGLTDSNLRTVSVLAAKKNTSTDEITRGVVFYLDGKVIVGVLLLNIYGPGIEIARRIISDGKEHDNFKEVAKLFDLHRRVKENEVTK